MLKSAPRSKKSAAQRPLWVELPEECASWQLIELHGSEAVSELFDFELTLRSPKDLDEERAGQIAGQLLRRGIAFGLHAPSGGDRALHGLVVRATQSGPLEWRLTVAPWLWLLTQATDCRVFVDKTVRQIVTAVFEELGYLDFRFELSGGAMPVLRQCVQYRESTANFVLRLLEQEGLFFHWEHAPSSHTLVVTDSAPAAPQCPVQPRLALRRLMEISGARPESGIHTWRRTRAIVPDRYVLHDYDQETPEADLLVSAAAEHAAGGPARLEVFDGQGQFRTRAAGQRCAQRRMEAEEARRDVISGTSDVVELTAGTRFERAEMPGEFFVTRVRHDAEIEAGYENSFECVPLAAGFRPARVTPRPTIPGVHTALVVGPDGKTKGAGAKVHTDGHGRVRVQFRWARLRRDGQNLSAWVRVMQPGGQMRIPRIGEEVAVAFEDGDPDRPLVLGSAYAVPKSLPFNPAKWPESQTMLQPFPQPGEARRNEMRFDCRPGREKVVQHAGRDLVSSAGRNNMQLVGGDRTATVRGNEATHVFGNAMQVVDKESATEVAGGYSIHAKGAISIRSDKSVYIHAPDVVLVGSGGAFVRVKGGVAVVEAPLTKINCGESAPALGSAPAPQAAPPQEAAEDE